MYYIPNSQPTRWEKDVFQTHNRSTLGIWKGSFHQSRWRHPAKASSSYFCPKGWVSQNSVSFRVIVVVLEQSDFMFLFRKSLKQIYSSKDLWRDICFQVSCSSLAQIAGSLVSPQLFSAFISQNPPPLSVAWIVDISHPYNSTVQKKIICVFTPLGYSLGWETTWKEWHLHLPLAVELQLPQCIEDATPQLQLRSASSGESSPQTVQQQIVLWLFGLWISRL